MNLLCPNCQKMLTVPEEFAGQLMKCPLCTGTFTVPSLPGTAAPPAAPPSRPEPDIYSLHPEPPSPPTSLPPAPFVSDREPPSTTAPPSPSLSPLPPEDYQHSATVWL